jgi:uncharacterized protein YjaZ
MRTNWIPTNEYYHRLIDTPGADSRHRLFMEHFVAPWKPMMQMMQGMPGVDPEDELGGARAWGWLLPDQVAEMADLLQRLEVAAAWQTGADALQAAAARFTAYTGRIPFNSVEGWLVLADPARSNPLEPGYTGATDWMQPRFICQFWEPNEYNLSRLPALVAHEMHHLVRLRAFPWGMDTTVADYLVIEGTAESFAVSLFGEERAGYYVTDVDGEALETARRLAGEALGATGFDVIRGYIFGDALAERSGFKPVGGMPTYGGYALGYHVVQAFLARSGITIEEATFLPAAEIVEGSGFFT